MPHCSAWKWNRHSAKNFQQLSFHVLPGEDRKYIRQAWINAIGRKTLPKSCYLCSLHFEEDCFDKSYDLKQKLCPQKDGEKKSRRLTKTAVPSIFEHRQVPLKRNSSAFKKKVHNQMVAEALATLQDETVSKEFSPFEELPVTSDHSNSPSNAPTRDGCTTTATLPKTPKMNFKCQFTSSKTPGSRESKSIPIQPKTLARIIIKKPSIERTCNDVVNFLADTVSILFQPPNLITHVL